MAADPISVSTGTSSKRDELESFEGPAFKLFHVKSYEEYRKSQPSKQSQEYALEDFLDLAKCKWSLVSLAKKSNFFEQSKKAPMPPKKTKEEKKLEKKKEEKKAKKKAKDPNAPKKPSSSFMLFSQDYRSKLDEEAKKVPMLEMAKILGQKWKEIGQEEKDVFVKMANEAKTKYQEQMEAYQRENPVVKVDKLGFNLMLFRFYNVSFYFQVPVKPKGAKTGFIVFSEENRKKMKDENPEAGFGDLGKRLGEAWNAMDEASRKPFMEKAQLDRKRFEEEMAAYKLELSKQ